MTQKIFSQKLSSRCPSDIKIFNINFKKIVICNKIENLNKNKFWKFCINSVTLPKFLGITANGTADMLARK